MKTGGKGRRAHLNAAKIPNAHQSEYMNFGGTN